MRHVPKTMSTQHPDNASKPYWHGDRFIDSKHEAHECFLSFKELGCTEYMWDWEGKHVDEAVVERLFEQHGSFFEKNELGKDLFLTFRVPNIWQESGYRIARAFVSIITANDLAQQLGRHAPPIFEAILPMTTDAQKLFFIRKKYAELAKAFTVMKQVGPADIEVIPLVEEPQKMASSKHILKEYVSLWRKDSLLKKKRVSYLRPFFARSDPALNSGLVPAVLGVKLGLSSCFEFQEQEGISVYPIIGAGSLPFRGGLRPDRISDFCKEYSGVHTATIQSAFKYDFPLPQVRKAVAKLNYCLGNEAVVIDAADAMELNKVLQTFSADYQKTVESIASDINRIAAFVPKRRERRLHIGLFGYSRKMGKKSLPRAIAFVSSLYSMGIPPELIGFGESFQKLSGKQKRLLQRHYISLEKDLLQAGYFLNKENLATLSGKNSGWKSIAKDVSFIQEFLGTDLGPVEDEHFIHRNLTSNVRLLLAKGRDPAEEIVRAGEIRKSLG